MLHDPAAFPRLRGVSVFACFAGGGGSAAAASLVLARVAPGTPWRLAAALLFAARAAVGAALGLALLRLPSDPHAARDRFLLAAREAQAQAQAQAQVAVAGAAEAEGGAGAVRAATVAAQAQKDEESPPAAAVAPLGRGSGGSGGSGGVGPFQLSRLVRHQSSHFVPWWLSCVACFASFAWLRADAATAAAAASSSPPSSSATLPPMYRSEPLRVLETPPVSFLGFLLASKYESNVQYET